jgi:hypothetical protein
MARAWDIHFNGVVIADLRHRIDFSDSSFPGSEVAIVIVWFGW